MPVVFILFFSALIALAQHTEQPEKESSTDLRNQSVVFSIVQKGKTYSLEKTPNLQYFLKLKEGEKETIKKVDGRKAQELDRDFSSRFLKCQYEYASAEGPCEVTLRLTLKGEGQEICAKDEKKSREMDAFIDNLNKRF